MASCVGVVVWLRCGLMARGFSRSLKSNWRLRCSCIFNFRISPSCAELANSTIKQQEDTYNRNSSFIRDNFVLIALKQNIFRFQVSVANFLCMTVRNCRQKLLYNNSSIFFVEFLSWDNLIKQLTALAVLCHKIYVLFVFKNFIQP